MIRRNAFWTIDKLKGGALKKSLNDIQKIIFDVDSEDAIQRKSSHLKSLLSHAIETTSFYGNFNSTASLEDFPVVDKNKIRVDYQYFISSKYHSDKLKKISTSGSTGIPFTIHQCEKKTIRNQADNLFFSQLCGYYVGNPFYYLRIWNEVNKKSKLSFFLQNTIPLDISDLSENSILNLIHTLDKLSSNSVILAYGSTYEVLSNFMVEKSLRLKSRPKVAFVMSDPINHYIKQSLSAALNCPIYSRYSNAENGFLGHQWQMDSEDYLVNTASYNIEFLAFDEDRPVREGEPGRVVVTDLFNYAVPVIRYDTGDIAIKGKFSLNGVEVPVFKSIEGRKLDFIFNSKGDFISPHTIDYALRSMPNLIQFQLVQKGKKEYVLKLLVRERILHFDEDARTKLRVYLGSDANIKVKFVNEIPVLKSGKRQIVVNEMPVK